MAVAIISVATDIDTQTVTEVLSAMAPPTTVTTAVLATSALPVILGAQPTTRIITQTETPTTTALGIPTVETPAIPEAITQVAQAATVRLGVVVSAVAVEEAVVVGVADNHLKLERHEEILFSRGLDGSSIYG